MSKIVLDLYSLLANTYSLYFSTLSCHWNVEDPRFLSLHQMFETQYEELQEHADLIAERIRQMGSKVKTSFKAFEGQNDLNDINENASANQMLQMLVQSHEKIIKDLETLSQVSEKQKDYGLVDLLGGLLRDHEKTAWILRSHL